MKQAHTCELCMTKFCEKTGIPCARVEAMLPSPYSGRRPDHESAGIMNPHKLLESQLTRHLVSQNRRKLARLAEQYAYALSARERVVTAFVWGMACSTRETAEALDVDRKTIRIYLRRAATKILVLACGKK